MRIEADGGKGEFRHVRLADDDGAGRAKAPDDRRVRCCRRRRAADDGARKRRLARDVKEVLDGDDPPVEGPEALALAPPPVGSVRFRAGCLGIELHINAFIVPPPVEAGENGFEAVAGGRI